MKLYELTDQFFKLEELAIDVDTAEDSEAFSVLWDEINMQFELKAENTAKVIRNLDLQAEALKAEEARLQARRKALEKSSDRLRVYLEHNMQANGLDKINGEFFTLAIQKNPPALDLFDPDQLPDDYWVIKRTPDNAKVKTDLKDGKYIPGAKLVQGSSLRIM